MGGFSGFGGFIRLSAPGHAGFAYAAVLPTPSKRLRVVPVP